jgi:hypothetical protein
MTVMAQQILLRAGRLGIGCDWLRRGLPREGRKFEEEDGRKNSRRARGQVYIAVEAATGRHARSGGAIPLRVIHRW